MCDTWTFTRSHRKGAVSGSIADSSDDTQKRPIQVITQKFQDTTNQNQTPIHVTTSKNINKSAHGIHYKCARCTECCSVLQCDVVCLSAFGPVITGVRKVYSLLQCVTGALQYVVASYIAREVHID